MKLNPLVIVATAVIIAGCDRASEEAVTTDMDASAKVTGTLVYRERIIPKPGTVAEVWLLDISRADAPARELAHRIIEDPGPPPIAFTLEYDPADVDGRMSYGVRAVLRRGERLIFTSDTNYPVLTRGAGNSVEVMLVAAPQ
jgi:putative lipoprotein